MHVYKVKVEFENDITGEPAHPPLTIAVTRNDRIQTAQDAVKHCMESIGGYRYPLIDGEEPKVKQITRIHHKDDTTGERFSIVSCVPVRETPFNLDEAPVIRSLADAPKKVIP